MRLREGGGFAVPALHWGKDVLEEMGSGGEELPSDKQEAARAVRCRELNHIMEVGVGTGDGT